MLGELKCEYRPTEANEKQVRTAKFKFIKWNGQMHGQSEINKFTYSLAMRKQNGMVRCMVRVKSTSSHTL